LFYSFFQGKVRGGALSKQVKHKPRALSIPSRRDPWGWLREEALYIPPAAEGDWNGKTWT